MLNIFRKKVKKITDEVLGVLTFSKSNGLEESYWTVNRKIVSVNEPVEFCIYNDSNGINKNQKEQVLLIEKKYPELVNIIEAFINVEIKKNNLNSIKLSVPNDLCVNFIAIPNYSTEKNTWELNLMEKKGFANYEIQIENWIPVSLGISA